VSAIPIGLLLAGSGAAYVKTRTVPTLLWLAGAVCLSVVVLTHIAEGNGWLPAMRWGAPDSAGHYLDVSSAALGVSLIVAGTVARFAHR